MGKQGASLFSALESISAIGYTSHNYSDLWNYFLITDLDANGKIWDMYSTCSFTPRTNQCGSYSAVCSCYNREHSLPKSWFGGSDSNAPGTDLFHLYPTDGKVNGQRGNNAFGECAAGGKAGDKALGKLGASTFEGYTNVGTVFEPDDMYKGDFARSYFGMLVRYGTSFAFNQADGGVKMFSNSGRSITAQNHFGLTAYSVALLMKWTRLDPVSTKETNRNNGIQQTQGNRNPFIDCPVLAEYLWGDKTGTAVTSEDLMACGCIDSTYSAIEGIPAETLEEVSRLASVSLTPMNGGLTLTCLPVGAQVLLFDARGTLLSRTKALSPEMTLSTGDGFFLVVLAIGSETRHIKVLH
ncbi:MAG: endonuclease [Paludibacteraceae bacterium]|nr:endonuclease [Paludibacteraceae bacterium]